MVTLSSLKAADAALVAETLESLRESTVMTNLMRVQNFPPNNNTVRFVKDGSFEFTTTAENASIGTVSYTETSVDVAAAKGGARVQVTHEASRFRDAQIFGKLGAEAGRAAGTWIDAQAVALFSGFSGSAGTTTVDLTVATFRSAMLTLELSKVKGDLVAVLHPQQLFDLGTDLLAATGNPYVQAVELSILNDQTPLPNGYRGNFLGVDIFVTTAVPTANAGADRLGLMFDPQRAICAAIDPQIYRMEVDTPEFLRREAAFAIYGGFAELDNASGVGILSDA